MLKKPITFTNFNDEEVTKEYFFHLSKADLIRMEVEVEGGLGEYLTQIVAAKNDRAIMAAMEKIILSAYGIKSDDGNRFIKNAQLREEFEQTEAYSQLLMELCTDENAATQFLLGIVPHNLRADLAKGAAKPKPHREATAEDIETLEGPESVTNPTPMPPDKQRVLTVTEASHMDHNELTHLLATGQAVLGK